MSTTASPASATTSPRSAGKRTTLIFIGIAILSVAGVWAAVAMRAPATPNNDAAKLAKVASAPEFTTATPDKQRQWMTSMSDRKAQIVAAYKAGSLNEQEFKSSMNLGWMAKQEDHMTKYYRLAPGKQRDAYLDKLAKKHYAAKDSAKADPTLDDGFNHDRVWEQNWISKWSLEKQTQYQAYCKALEDRCATYKATVRAKK